MNKGFVKRSVTFKSASNEIAGELYTPDADKGRPQAAVVVSHPASGVKEQTAGLYAKRLAARGFIALAFDASYQGESGGFPRGLEEPTARVEDAKAAVTFLSLREEVDPKRIGHLGICAAGGYVIPATATDRRVKAVATVSGTDIGWFFRKGFDNKQQPNILEGMLNSAAKARVAEAHGAGIQTFPIFPASEADAKALGQYVYEGWQYYCSPRGENPRSTKQMPWLSVERIAAFDGLAFTHMVAPTPLLMIAGTNADTKWMSEQACSAAKYSKELFWIEGASHVDLYDKEQFVSQAITRLVDFYGEHLLS